MFCPKCGNQLRDGARFCGACGAEIEAPAPATGTGAATPGAAPGASIPAGIPAGVMKTKRNNTPFILGGAALAVVILIIVIAFVVKPFGGGYSSADSLIDDTADAMETLYSSDITSDTLSKFTDKVLGYVPKDYVDALVAHGPYSSSPSLAKQEIASDLVGYWVDSYYSSSVEELEYYNTQREDVDFDVSFTLSSSLSDTAISELEQDAAMYGVSCDIQEARYVNGSISATKIATSINDIDDAGVGDTSTGSISESENFLVVKIDGGWYLWPND